MWHRSSYGALRAEASFEQRQFRPRARDILISWAKAREYLDGETRYLKMANSACEPSVQDRFIAIARHYRSLATIEKSIADQRPNKNAHN